MYPAHNHHHLSTCLDAERCSWMNKEMAVQCQWRWRNITQQLRAYKQLQHIPVLFRSSLKHQGEEAIAGEEHLLSLTGRHWLLSSSSPRCRYIGSVVCQRCTLLSSGLRDWDISCCLMPFGSPTAIHVPLHISLETGRLHVSKTGCWRLRGQGCVVCGEWGLVEGGVCSVLAWMSVRPRISSPALMRGWQKLQGDLFLSEG